LANSRCWHHSVVDPNDNGLCTNCHHWDFDKRKCKDHELLKQRRYEESKAFKAYDRAMRQNKGVRVD